MEIAVLIVIVLLILLWGFFKARVKGVIGEKTIATILYFLDKKKYKVIHNLVLKSDNYTAQIDHIVISDFGIFVIETKNYKGWILGNENSEYWTQVIYKRKESFYNPILQNRGHITALRKCLVDYPKIEYKSIIVFPSKATIKVNTVTDVVYSYNLLRTIRKYVGVNLTAIDQKNIYDKICTANLIDTFDQSEHVRSIKQRIKLREASINANKCPQCSGDLVVRAGKYGNFLGCQTYPLCKFTRKV